ncbi:rhodanese-like domain-containing protein [Halobacteriovorax sp. GB3]|uniref:rhodanese-like domain-containing protein n=1 Tax=Halobacteriovorax sp. GB3 TaxID=2719615 RepID=UPI0023602A1B|nr:rhodanese-like domain-containing protein [Halobacteriovorax sp. GB3]MDD0852666.1 rhodanese-like domain-containing protein [Halobacteriovorax sp. GB3]
MDLRIFQMLEFMNTRLSNIEKNISRIDEKLEFSIALQRNHLIRVKNGENIDDNMILMGRPYNDLSPSDAFDIFNNVNMDFLVLDVSEDEYIGKSIAGAIKIPLEELDRRYAEIQNKTTPIMIISEKGLRSIKACEMLVKKGFFNVNNISGGHEFWPGKESHSPSPSA